MKKAAILVLAVLVMLSFVFEASGYESNLFDDGYVHRIDVRISEEDWHDLLENAAEKTKYRADIEIDGESVADVAFSTKGNSSLMFVAADPDSSRYSFKVNFGKYTKGQTFHGLKKLNLSNNFNDPTYVKDALCYGLFRQAGVPAPLTSYVWLSINGRDQGLYLAVEDLDESFLDRAYDGAGVIYKPECGNMDLTAEMVADIKANGLSMSTDPHGADLVYQDDSPESYPDIFENAETKADEQGALAVIAAMKCLAEGEDPDGCLDTEEIIRYFTAHNFVLNYDSYLGGMLHNMVLIERDGKLSVAPWDYNLAFGAFTPVVGDDVLRDATDLLNQGIDSPLIGPAEEERPLWGWIVKDGRYLSRYHEMLGTLVTDYFGSGRFEREFDDLVTMLLPYVRKAPTAFYSAEEYGTACEMLKQFCLRRAESVLKQLDGELASVSGEQAESDKVDASDLRMSDMGAAV